MRFVLVIVVLTGCGRIGIEARSGEVADAAELADGSNSSPDAAGCPSDTVAIKSGSSVCIEKVERGTETWTTSKATCEGLGRRLCTDAEWAIACDNAPGLTDMFNDEEGNGLNWEWVADLVSAGEGAKRGYDACSAMSSHEIFVDAYDYRCCVDL